MFAVFAHVSIDVVTFYRLFLLKCKTEKLLITVNNGVEKITALFSSSFQLYI